MSQSEPMKVGDIIRGPAGKAQVTRITVDRIYFRYIRRGQLSRTERNVAR